MKSPSFVPMVLTNLSEITKNIASKKYLFLGERIILFHFRARYGIVHVNYDSPKRERTLKNSASFFRSLCKTRSLTQEDEE